LTITTGNAFDIVANKIVLSKTSIDNMGSYTADINLNVTNHKSTPVDIIVTFTNGYADNLKITTNQNNLLQKISATEFRWRKVLGTD
jgi:hypothetical protein